MAAFALAAAMVCTSGDPLGCGECSACRRALTLNAEPPCVPAHPDVVLLGRGLYPAAMLGSKGTGTAGIGLPQITRIVLERMAFAPHEARSLIFIVRDAEELTQGAANALLKTLEEPPPGVHFVLLTHRPERLLDTIRSRTLPIRFGPLSDAVLKRIVAEQGLVATDEALSLAAGSAATALELSNVEKEGERIEFLNSIRSCVQSADLGPGLQFAGSLRPDRDSLKSNLQALSQHFAVRLRRSAADKPAHAQRLAYQYEETQKALEHLERNTPPVLVLETLIARLRRAA